jgi:RNA polymerase sigma factor (sigma-70 family)
MEEFWNIAYRENAPALIGVLRRYVKDESIAQDLLHEVFITAIDKHHSYAGKGNIDGWLYRIAVNTALMHLRSERRKQSVILEMEPYTMSLHDNGDADEAQIDNARNIIETADFSSEELLAAIDRLPEHHKLVFNMYVMDNFSHRQIGAELNISSGTSKSHLKRARHKIQQYLYDEAMNRKKNKDRRRASAFLLLFPAKEHYIDMLYRRGLSNLRIPPTGGSEFLTTALEQQAASTAASVATSAASAATSSTALMPAQTAFWGGKLLYIAASCGVAVATSTALWLSLGDDSRQDNDVTNTVNEQVIVNDTLNYLPDLIEMENNFTDETVYRTNANQTHAHEPSVNPATPAKPEPHAAEETIDTVYVTKQIIERQTVVVRDTIYIEEDE